MKSFSFKAYGLKWRVKIVSKHEKIVGNFGYCSIEDQTIYIAKNATEDQQKSTLLHELIHLVEQTNQLNMSEHTVLVLEAGLYSIIVGNRINLF